MSGFQDTILPALERLIEPLAEASAGESSLLGFFAEMGWDLSSLNSSIRVDLLEAIIGATSDARALIDAGTSGAQGPAAFLALLQSTSNLFSSIGRISEAFANLEADTSIDTSELARELLDNLIVAWLRRYHPVFYRLARLLTIVTARSEAQPVSPITLGNGVVVRRPVGLPRINLDRLPLLLQDPAGTLSSVYVPDGLVDAAAVQSASDRLFAPLRDLVGALGGEWAYGVPKGVDLSLAPEAESLAERLLSVAFRFAHDKAEVGTSVWLSGQDTSDLGVVFAPFGELNVQRTFPGWVVLLSATPSLDNFSIGPHGLVLAQDDPLDAQIELAFLKLQRNSGPAFTLGSDTGSRLEFGELSVSVGANLAASGDYDFGGSIRIDTGSLVVGGEDADSFLSWLLPEEGLRANFGAHLRWTRKRGFHFEGSSDLALSIPLNLSVGEVLTVDQLVIEVEPDSESLAVTASANCQLQLGVIELVVEEVGVALELAFPGDGGNLGPVDLSLGFKPPTGLGISIDADFASGSGYLEIDVEAGEYSGFAAVDVLNVGVTAVGLLATRLPDGSDGWSMFLSLSATFSALQLGFGFTLNGVGGLVGVNRGLNAEALGQGIRDGSMDSILFPDDPIAEAPRILSDLGAIFPAQVGQYVFGPVAKIGWGTPTLIEADVGVVIQLPDPLTISLLGSLSAVLPDEETALLVFNLDVAGTVDVTAGTLAVDASLRDSQVVGLALSGDMALRASFIDSPSFLMSLGGFNPHFVPPTGFPSLNRLSVSLDTGDALRIGLWGYFALTSNTVQFGAGADLWAQAAGLTVEGHFDFDALIQFKPFHFIFEMGFSVDVRAATVDLFGVHLALMVEGPNPFHVVGTASMKILGLQTSFEVDETIGQREIEGPTEVVDVRALLIEALTNTDSWREAALLQEAQPVILGEPSGLTPNVLLVHPAGLVEVVQRVVPLGSTLEKFGTAELRDQTRFELVNPTVGGKQTAALASISEWFAVTQFFELRDEEKLSAPSFELMPSGLRFGDEGVLAGKAKSFALDFEQIIRDPDLDLVDREPDTLFSLSGRALETAVSQSSRLRAASPSVGSPYSIASATYVVVDTDTGEPDTELAAEGGVSWSVARGALLDAEVPGPRILVPSHELSLEDRRARGRRRAS